MKLNEDRARIVGKGKLKVNLRNNGNHRAKMKKKVITNGVLAGSELCDELGITKEQMKKIMGGFERILRAGYEVRFGLTKDDAIRLYPCLNQNYDVMFVASAVIGEGFRNCVSDLNFTLHRKGEEIDVDEAVREEDAIAEEKSKMICVTPDTMVKCPECGYEFRVGKVLTDVK